VHLFYEKTVLVGVAQTDRALDCGSGATEQKGGDSKPKRRISKKTQNDLLVDLQDSPDLQQVIRAWPELPEHIKAAVRALVQAHISTAEQSQQKDDQELNMNRLTDKQKAFCEQYIVDMNAKEVAVRGQATRLTLPSSRDIGCSLPLCAGRRLRGSWLRGNRKQITTG
jgi:hypothetical protein